MNIPSMLRHDLRQHSQQSTWWSSANQDIPIIIFHVGNQEYVHYCLRQAKKYNKYVIILTNDTRNFKNIPVKIVNYSNYSHYLKAFTNLYKHFSTNSSWQELICIVRWFVIYEYMKEQKIKRAFICDSDVLIYDNITEINNKYLSKYDFMLCSSHSKDVTGGQSIWNIDKLQEFTKFSFDFYKTQMPNIEKWHKTYTDPGGICDMTLLYYFSHGKPNFIGLQLPSYPTISNDLTQIFDNELTFDLHLLTHGNHLYPNDYEVDETNNNKNIKYINGKPYCFNKRLNKDIRFVLLHFQGRNKGIMKEFYLKT